MNIEILDKLGKPYKVFAESLEQGAIDQFVSYMEQPWVKQGAMMPDAHTGYSLPIGAVIASEGMVSPQAVGYDIGCGMCAVPTSFSREYVEAHKKEIFDQIYRDIPVGFNHNKTSIGYESDLPYSDFLNKAVIEAGALGKQRGTLGSGNHFLEVGYDENDLVWIVLHSGSRNVGHKVATEYMKKASGTDKASEGAFALPVDSDDGKNYIMDMNYALAFALANRKTMIERAEAAIARYVKDGEAHMGALINRNHNHAELRDGLWIHRKGATHAEEGMMGVIPGNMRDGSFIVRGKGNPVSLYSSSHGAGRIMGRKEAQRKLDMNDFSITMAQAGVQALVTKGTLDESPFAYKDIFEVMRLQSELVDVVAHVRPLINIKG